MILNNTQANIFKVNGGIADNFANRPAASASFYIFYSIDTQEIFYDNGAWVLLGSGGGGGVNIYNSDGTLTGNRTLSGANNSLTFTDLQYFFTKNGSDVIGLEFDFTNEIFIYGSKKPGNENYLIIDNNQKVISTFINNQQTGLLIDPISNNTISLIDSNTQTQIRIDSANKNVIINADNSFDVYDNTNGYDALSIIFPLQLYRFGQVNGGNTSLLTIDDINQIIKTSNQGNDIGLKLDFANSVYQFGQITGGNQTFFEIDDIQNKVRIINAGLQRGFFTDFTTTQTWIGNGANGTIFEIYDNQNILRCQSNISGINGFSIDLANYNFKFGRFNGGNTTYLTIDDAAAYPVQIDGTNISSGTAGGSSGQHLKIKINGVDYKIALLNP